MTSNSFIENSLTDNEWLIFRHETNEFLLNSIIIVNEGQVALLVRNNEPYYLLPTGKHHLLAENFSESDLVMQIDDYGNSLGSFNGNLYFINTNSPIAFKWKTNTPIEFMGFEENFPSTLHLSGKIKIIIEDFADFLCEFALKPNYPPILSKQQIITQLNLVLTNKLCEILPKTFASQYILEPANFHEIASQTISIFRNSNSFPGIEIDLFTIEKSNSQEMNEISNSSSSISNKTVSSTSYMASMKNPKVMSTINSKFLKIIIGSLELVMSIPLLFSFMLSNLPLSLIPLAIILGLHIINLMICRKENAKMHGSIMGIIVNGTVFALIPYFSSLLHLVTGVLLLIEGLKKNKSSKDISFQSKIIDAGKMKIISIITAVIEALIGIPYLISSIGKLLGQWEFSIDAWVAFPLILLVVLHVISLSNSKGELKSVGGNIIGIISCSIFSNLLSFKALGHIISSLMILHKTLVTDYNKFK